MKREGFTLVELLAVIAILTLLIIIAVPNVTKIFNDAKKETFISETKIIYKEALREYVKRSRTQKVTYISSTDDTKLNLDGIDYQYYFVFYDDGELQSSKISDGTYIVNIAGGSDINDIKTSDVELGKIEKFDYDEILATPVSFAKDSWSTIQKEAQKCVNNESYDCKYKVGDTKEIALNLDGVNETIKTIRIANMSTPAKDGKECGANDFSQTACGFVIEFVENLQVNQKMNIDRTNTGGWSNSNMRNYLNNQFINTLPNDLKSVIIETKVVSGLGKSEGCSSSGGGGGRGSSSSCTKVNISENDKLYMLAPKEIFSDWSSSYDSAQNKTRQLDYYSAQGTSSSNVSAALKNCYGTYDEVENGVIVKKNATGSWYYFLRTAHANDNSSFFGVAGNDAKLYPYNPDRFDLCVSVLFRIAANEEITK